MDVKMPENGKRSNFWWEKKKMEVKKFYEIFIGFIRFILIRMQILQMLSPHAVLTFTK